MTRFVTFYALALALSAIPGGLAGPGCAKKYHKTNDCVKKCQSKWGWKGHMMGTNRWGSVISKEPAEVWESIVSQACGTSPGSLPASTASSAAATPTLVTQPGPVIGAGSDPAESTLAAPTASPVHSVASSSVVSSAVSSATDPASSSVTRITPPVALPTTTRVTTSARPTAVPATTRPAATQAPPPPPPSNPGSGSGSSGSTSSGDIQAYLIGHNSVRANHGAAALVWSDELAGKAQQWANGCQFRHSGGSLGPYGENLAAGTGSAYGISEAIKSWTDEVTDFDGNNPQPSHFTQVVWVGTQQVGCAVQACDGIFPNQNGKAKYYVCEYFPAGNVIGRFAQNVRV